MEWYCSLQFNNANVATKEAAPVFAAGSAIFWASQDLACYNRASEFLDILGIKSFLPSTWGHGPISAFSFQDQVLFDKVLYNNLDIISSNKKIDK